MGTGSLYFCRIDRFGGSIEGALPGRVADHVDELKRIMMMPDLLGRVPDSSLYVGHVSARRQYQQFFYANCWHVNANESTAMWRLYLSAHDGVAIKTSFSRMRQAMRAPGKGRLCGGLVSYVDWESDAFDALDPSTRTSTSVLNTAANPNTGSCTSGVLMRPFVREFVMYWRHPPPCRAQACESTRGP